MINHSCRLCSWKLKSEALVHLERMPINAQGFLAQDQIGTHTSMALNVVGCEQCGLVQTTSTPVSYWREVIRANAFSGEMQKFREDFFARFVNEYQLPGKKFLEIGCGRGEYLDLLKRLQVKTYGTEYSRANAKIAQRAGHSVQAIFPDDGYAINHGPFAAFGSFNFVEHWPDPRRVFSVIRAHLNDDAIGIVEVPNADMILSRFIFNEFISDHVSYFTKNTLQLLLNISGFDVLRCEPIWHDYILSAVVRKRSQQSAFGFSNARSQLGAMLDRFVDIYKRDQIAVWGAGHQALATLSLFNLDQRVAGIIDSAPFKQGLYAPGTHLPIYNPDWIKTAALKAIIIMAAGYSDEVLRILRRDFDPNIKVAILRGVNLEIVGND